jgi:hypothetical protein
MAALVLEALDTSLMSFAVKDMPAVGGWSSRGAAQRHIGGRPALASEEIRPTVSVAFPIGFQLRPVNDHIEAGPG